MRALWKGTVIVGEVAIPATLHKAAEHDDPSFRSLHRPCGTPIKQHLRCPTCEVELEGYSETVRSHEFAEGQFVEVENAQLEAALGGKVVKLDKFIENDLVPAALVSTTYWLSPVEGDRHAVRAYDGLLRGLDKLRFAGLGAISLYSKERVALVRPLGDHDARVLGMQTLFLPREVRTPKPIADRLVGANAAVEEEVDLFARAIEQRHVPTAFRWDRLERYYPRRVPELLEQLVAGGQQIAVPQPDVSAPRDLVEALTKSIRGRTRRPGKRVSTASRR